jgi:hypothetical protein
MKLIIKKKDDAPERSYFAHQYTYVIEDKDGGKADITRSLQEIDIHMSIHDPNRLHLTVMPENLELDAQFLTDLEIFLEHREVQDAVDKSRDVTTAGSEHREVAGGDDVG